MNALGANLRRPRTQVVEGIHPVSEIILIPCLKPVGFLQGLPQPSRIHVEYSRHGGGVRTLELGRLFDPLQPAQTKQIRAVSAARPQAKAQA